MSRRSFEQCVLASGLVTAEQLAEARRAIVRQRRDDGSGLPIKPGPVTDEQLAQKLIEMGLLNPWQAKQLFKGRSKFNLGPYRIIDSLGRGGMGEVFKAEHGYMKRVVAIKVLPRTRSTPESIASFVHEIRTLARLDHPNLVRALDAGEDGNVHYLVTEYVPGGNLRAMIRSQGPLTMRAAANIICQVAAGLHHAHQQGFVHRDVKPGNVLVTPDGRAKLSDLGLAGPLGEEASSDPRFGKIVGTADYLSPDQIRAPRDPKPAWDIYSLGCTLYYAVTGKVPFPGGTTADKVRAHCELLPLDPRRLNPTLDEQFVDVMAEMMAKDPADRIATASAVVARLSPWMELEKLADEVRSAMPAVHSSQNAALRVGAAWATRQARGGGSQGELPDTESSMPEMSGSVSQAAGASGSCWPLQETGSQDDDATVAPHQPQAPIEWNQPLVYHPLVVLVVVPALIAGLVVLASLLFSALL